MIHSSAHLRHYSHSAISSLTFYSATSKFSPAESGGGFHDRLSPVRAPLLALSPRWRLGQRLRPVLPQLRIRWRRQHRAGARREASPRHTRCRSCVNVSDATQHRQRTLASRVARTLCEKESGFLLFEFCKARFI